MVEIELKYEIKDIPSTLHLYKQEMNKEETDIYFDNPSYNLIKKGNFLRLRNNSKVDFKLNIGDLEHLYCKETNFHIKDISDCNNNFINVFNSIGVEINNEFTNFESFIKINKFVELARIVKHRMEYSVTKNIKVTIDQIDNLGIYLEAEMMVDEDSIDELYIRKCKEQLLSVLEEHGLLTPNDKSVKIGYVELFLQKYNFEVYEMGLFKL